MLGILYAWSMYQSLIKRAIFVIGSAVIGVVGNWIRVYLTIMIAHHTENRYLRDDHYMFGWILFAFFLFMFCWFGWRYRDAAPQLSADSQSSDGADANPSAFRREVSTLRISAITLAILASLAIWPILQSILIDGVQTRTSTIEDLPPRGGWSPVAGQATAWTPEIRNPTKFRVQSFEKHGRRVDVFVGIYANETWDSKLVTVSNRLASDDSKYWNLADRGAATTAVSGTPLEVKTGVVLGSNSRILAWHWYWVNGFSTANDTRAKLQQLWFRLQRIQTAPAWVAVYTGANVSSEAASKVLQEFMQDMGLSLDSALAQTVK
jgi:EpsI family protein